MAELTYFKKFPSKTEYDAYISDSPILPNVSIVADEDVYYKDGNVPPTPPQHDYSKDYLTFKISSPGTINWMTTSNSVKKTIEYKLNNGEWASITSNTGTSVPTINVAKGDKIQFRGNNSAYGLDYSTYSSFSGSTAKFDVCGNIMSLVDSTEYESATTISSAYAFDYLFSFCTGITHAENLVLPATGLTDYCYYQMFNNCVNLTTAPELPATTLTLACYCGMFNGCASLTTAPELPATTLANYCYSTMFQGCTSLTTAPELPAKTLKKQCYQYMFYGCTSLTTAPSLPATTLATYCYYGMFSGCKSLTAAPELPATTLASYCYSNMFNGCTSLTTAPDLPATTLAEGCYGAMFRNCVNLTTAPELPATALIRSCYDSMFNGCTSLNYIKAMFTTTPTRYETSGWVSGVSPTGTFVKNRAATWNVTGENGIPSGWTVKDAAQ